MPSRVLSFSTLIGGGGQVDGQLSDDQDQGYRQGSARRHFGAQEAKLPKNWEPDQNIMNEFHRFLLKEGIQFTEAEFAENNSWAKLQLKHEMYLTAFGAEEARKVRMETDPMVLKAIESMPKAKELLESAKKLIVQRASPPLR